jgi:hypothetical protein
VVTWLGTLFGRSFASVFDVVWTTVLLSWSTGGLDVWMTCLWIPVGLIWCIYCMDPYIPTSGIHTGNKPSTYRDPYRRWSSGGWIQCNCCMDPWSMEIRTHDHALHHHWTQKVKDWNPRPHYTTIDPKKSKDGIHDHALHHHWPQKVPRLEPTTMHYTYFFMGSEQTKF